jgi:hypothetical protein
MSPQNRERLEKHRHLYNSWVTDKTIVDPHGAINEIEQIIQEEWDGGYACMKLCGYCVGKMVEMAFKNMDNESN